jgi:CMP-N-acetylneuraminic acid synthetase
MGAGRSIMLHTQKVVALVPIKAHSERVPGKNFRRFCGKPLYHHILNTLERTYAIDEVVVDTDSPEIAHTAPRSFPKVRIVERPEELRGDMVSTNRLFKYDIEQVEADIYLQTHATNPLLKPETIAEALKHFVDGQNQYDSLFSVNAYQSRFYRADGTAINHDPENLIRTQDLDPVYEENSVLYVFTRESFAKHDRRIGLHPQMYETSRIESIDIDDEYTFRLAEILSLYAQGV